WGEPVLTSALTAIARGRLIYRGRDAIEMSESASLEDVAALLWGEYAPTREVVVVPKGALRERLFVALALRAADDPASRGRSAGVLSEEASRVLNTVVTAAADGGAIGLAHERLAKAWGVDDAAGDVIRRALVLLADHELNPSTFAARTAASTA